MGKKEGNYQRSLYRDDMGWKKKRAVRSRLKQTLAERCRYAWLGANAALDYDGTGGFALHRRMLNGMSGCLARLLAAHSLSAEQRAITSDLFCRVNTLNTTLERKYNKI